MTPSRIFITIVCFSFVFPLFAASVSGEVSAGVTSSHATSVVAAAKKPVVTAITHTQTKTLSYKSPAGNESIVVTVRTRGGVIIGASARPKTTNQTSLSKQKSFAKNLAKAVVGKKIKDFHVDVIG